MLFIQASQEELLTISQTNYFYKEGNQIIQDNPSQVKDVSPEPDGHFTMLYQIDFQEDKVVYIVKKEVNGPCSCHPEVTWMIQEPQEIIYKDFFKT